MSEPREVVAENMYVRPLVETDKISNVASMYVLVSHQELDNLVGRLMQMCELMGDIEQRNALKQEIKSRSREWLDGLYESSGYDKYTGATTQARVINDRSDEPVKDPYKQ